MHHAASALAGVASDMRAGKTEMISKQFNEKRSRLDFKQYGLAVCGERYCALVGRIRHFSRASSQVKRAQGVARAERIGAIVPKNWQARKTAKELL
jgi:hypothetical protein